MGKCFACGATNLDVFADGIAVCMTCGRRHGADYGESRFSGFFDVNSEEDQKGFADWLRSLAEEIEEGASAVISFEATGQLVKQEEDGEWSHIATGRNTMKFEFYVGGESE